MKRDEFLQSLDKGSAGNLYLFEGEEENLKQEALNLVREKFLPEGFEDLNETVLIAPEADDVIAAAETLPFMADRRLVIIRDCPGLTGKKEADDKLVDYLKNVSPSCMLIFYCIGKPDGRKKLCAAIKKNGKDVLFEPLKGPALSSWIVSRFHEQGKECSVRNADFLAFTSGSDTEQLKGEIAKIVSLIADRADVQPDDISSIATRSTECTVFQLTDAVVTGQDAKALALMKDLLRNGTERLLIVAMLLRHFRILRSLMIMRMEKQSPDFIRSAMGMAPFMVEQYTRQLSRISGKQIRLGFEACLDTEFRIKSGRIAQEGAVEALVLKLLNLMHT